MIKKIILFTAILFACYSFFTVSVAPIWWHASQHQWQDNIIKAQKFIYNDKDSFTNVIVGSSLSSRLVMDSLPNTCNLSFSGQSIYDGLNILSHKTTLPKNVFIEMNVVFREESKEFTAAVNSPILYYPKKIFLSLREDKQPIANLGFIINYKFTGPLLPALKSFFHLSKETHTDKKDNELFSKLLKMQIDNYSKLPGQDVLNNSFNKLKSYVSGLENKGVTIIFFEMPVNSQLNNLPLISAIRSAFYKNFPASKYAYVPIPGSVKYETTDGVHLNGEEALNYTIYLRQKIKGYLR